MFSIGAGAAVAVVVTVAVVWIVGFDVVVVVVGHSNLYWLMFGN
jgi:hypothetical protein